MIPHSVLSAGWIPFVVVFVLALLFAYVYIKVFQHSRLSELSSTISTTLALFVALMTVAVVPVDVFLISFMKNSNGTFKDWAADNETRSSIESTVTYTYYALYGCTSLFLFLVLPFMYFYYEDKEDADESVTVKKRCCTSIKYTVVFLLAGFIILMVGAFVPLHPPPGNYSIDHQLNYLENEFARYKKADQAISILIGVLSAFGMLSLLVYTGFGMSALPIGMISCQRFSFHKKEETSSSGLTKHERNKEKLRILVAKRNSGRNLTRFERNELKRIESEERVTKRIEEKKRQYEGRRCLRRCAAIFKPFESLFGVLLLLLSLLIIVSLATTNVEKLQHSLGPRRGYLLPQSYNAFNVVDKVMMYAEQVFPLDYILLCLIVLFFIMSSIAGLKKIGIWCCCIKMFRIRVNKTMPQALMFMVFLLMLIVVALNIVLLTLAPQYMHYGNQMYWHHHGNNTTLVKCTSSAPEGECTLSRFALLSSTLFFKAWIFGAFYYWCIWGLIGIYAFCFMYNWYSYCRTKEDIELLDSDSDDSENELLIA